MPILKNLSASELLQLGNVLRQHAILAEVDEAAREPRGRLRRLVLGAREDVSIPPLVFFAPNRMEDARAGVEDL